MPIIEKIYRRLLREAEGTSGEELSAKIEKRVLAAYTEELGAAPATDKIHILDR